MKSIIITLALTLVLGNTYSKPIRDVISVKEPPIIEEAYVDDIPFNTELIAAGAMMNKKALTLKEEAYVEDIPFDTRSIASSAQLCKIIAESMAEADANDIPFNTRRIFEECMMAKLIRDYQTEWPATDIHFDTRWIACNYLLATAMETFRDEFEINDIPFETVCIVSADYDSKSDFVIVKCKSEIKYTSKHGHVDHYDYSIIQPIRFESPIPELDKGTHTGELNIVPGSSL